MATKPPPGPTPEQLQAYFLAKAETLFDDVSRIADALEVIAQVHLTTAQIHVHALNGLPEGHRVNAEGVLMYGNTPIGPILYVDDDAESSPETKPGNSDPVQG